MPCALELYILICGVEGPCALELYILICGVEGALRFGTLRFCGLEGALCFGTLHINLRCRGALRFGTLHINLRCRGALRFGTLHINLRCRGALCFGTLRFCGLEGALCFGTLHINLRCRGALRFGTLHINLRCRGALRFGTSRFCGLEGVLGFGTSLSFALDGVTLSNLSNFYAVEGSLGFTRFCVKRCVTLPNFSLFFLAGRGCDTNFTLWREDSTFCFDCFYFVFCLDLLVLTSWRCGRGFRGCHVLSNFAFLEGWMVPCAFRLYISAAGPPAGAKIVTLCPTHPPPSHRQWFFLCSLPVIKSPLPPLTPLPPAVIFVFFFFLLGLPVIKSLLLLPLTPLPPAVIFFCFLPVIKSLLLLPLTPLPPAVIFLFCSASQ